MLNFLYHSVIRKKLASNAKAGNITKSNHSLINIQADEALSISAKNSKNYVAGCCMDVLSLRSERLDTFFIKLIAQFFLATYA